MINLTIILVIVTALISYQAFSNISMRQQLVFHPYTVAHDGQWFRLLTHGFIHADWSHLLINMFVLYQFGEYVEYIFTDLIFGPAMGRIAYVLMYLSAIAIAALPAYFRHQNNPGYASLGASGATSAMVMAYVLVNPWSWFIFPPVPAIVFGIGYLWYSSYMGKRGGDNIAHDAHFWGAVYGVIFFLISIMALKPELLPVIWQNLLAGPTMPNF